MLKLGVNLIGASSAKFNSASARGLVLFLLLRRVSSSPSGSANRCRQINVSKSASEGRLKTCVSILFAASL
jgi:hypothetical protein